MFTFSIVGIFCIYGAKVTSMFAIHYTSTLTAIMVMQVDPVCTCVVVIIMKIEIIPSLREINGVLRVSGITCALPGAVVVILGSQSNSHTGFIASNKTVKWKIFGYACCFISILCWSFKIITQKRYIFSDIKSKWNSYQVYVIAWSVLCCTVFAGVVCLIYIGQPEKFINPVKGAAILPLLYSIFMIIGLSYTFVTWCTSQIDTSIVAAAWPLQA